MKNKVRNAGEAQNAICTLSITHICLSLHGYCIILFLRTFLGLLHGKRYVYFQFSNGHITIQPPKKANSCGPISTFLGEILHSKMAALGPSSCGQEGSSLIQYSLVARDPLYDRGWDGLMRENGRLIRL